MLVCLEGAVGDLKVTLIVELLALLLEGVVERTLTRGGDLVGYPIHRAWTLDCEKLGLLLVQD